MKRFLLLSFSLLLIVGLDAQDLARACDDLRYWTSQQPNQVAKRNDAKSIVCVAPPPVTTTIPPTTTTIPNTTGIPLQKGNLVYQCSFKVPTGIHAGGQANAGFEYGGTALGYDASLNGIYMVGHDWDQFTGEINIPACGGTATLLKPLVDMTNGKLSQINPGVANPKIGSNLIVGSTLVMSAFTFYDGSGTANSDHFQRTINQVIGPYRVGPLNPGYYGGYMTAIPAEYQSALGASYLTGQCCISIISRTSYGPSAFGFNPLATTQSAIPYLYYTQTNPLEPYGASGIHTLFNGATRIRAIMFPNGTPSVLFIGTQGVGNYCYGESPVPCNDPTSTNKGEHAYPYKAWVWAYNVNDLIAVKNGSKQPWSIKPYATWSLDNLNVGFDKIGSATYDASSAMIYISQKNADGDNPIIHKYKIQ